jgi:hypothetical protein
MSVSCAVADGHVKDVSARGEDAKFNAVRQPLPEQHWRERARAFIIGGSVMALQVKECS